MTEQQKDQQIEGNKVKIFPVPFSLVEKKENITLNTNNPSKSSKEQIINQAFKFHSQGNISEAAKNYQYFINQGFNDYRVFSNYGTILKDLGNLKQAERFIRKAIELNPNFANAHYNLGNILVGQGHIKEAELSTRKAIEINPDYAKAHLTLGNILRDLSKFKEAEISTRKAIEIKHDYAEAHSNLGNILRDLGKLKEAELSARKAIEIKPELAEFHYNIANIFRDLGKLEEAELSARKAIEINPDFDKALSNLGNILKDLGKLQEAELYTRKAIELQPDNAEVQNNLSLILLKRKRFKEGFDKSEWRLKIKDNYLRQLELVREKPEWTPNDRGKVLLWAEQGIGDEILFASLIPELVEKVDQLIIKCDERLIPLFKRSFNQNIIYINKKQLINDKKYDYHIAMGSVLKFLRTRKEDFKKAKKKYLKANKIKTSSYRDKLLKASKSKIIIGISWRSKSKAHKYRSISLEKFIMGIYSPNKCFVNLQYGDTKDEINNIKKKYDIDIFSLEEVDNLNNLDDLSSLVNACDLVVSIENLMFALAGSLGIDSKILLGRDCTWYNGDNDLKSYWLPNQTFYRQTSPGEWRKELNQLKNEIEDFT